MSTVTYTNYEGRGMRNERNNEGRGMRNGRNNEGRAASPPRRQAPPPHPDLKSYAPLPPSTLYRPQAPAHSRWAERTIGEECANGQVVCER
jgi:hypothetical protein